MKKIFVLTGEPSGDKLASEVISQIKTKRTDLEFLSVGGTNLQKLGINTIFDEKQPTGLVGLGAPNDLKWAQGSILPWSNLSVV